jgi:AcrR family transcriptional regulator
VSGDPRRYRAGGTPDDGRNGGAEQGGSDNADLRAERERLIDAFTRVAADRGYENTTVEGVVAAAGLTAADFHNHFSDMRQCLSAASEAFFARLASETHEAMAESDDWPVQVKGGVAAGFAFVSETAPSSRFFAIEALVAGPAALGRYQALTASIAEIMRAGRDLHPHAADLPDLLEPMLAGGLASIVTAALLTEEHSRLKELEAEVVELLLTPYLGRDEARRVAT